MDIVFQSLLTVLIFVVAALYSLVGHAGASGYIACFALFGLAPAVLKPTALTLNVLVASIASFKFCRAGLFSWRLFWPFAVASVPMAFVGGALVLPDVWYRKIVGLVLVYSAWRLFMSARDVVEPEIKAVPVWQALIWGGLLGLLSGLTGVGGGIFLSPLLLLSKWATARQASAVAAVFILANSIAGLSGNAAGVAQIPSGIWFWAPAACLGGWLGSSLGSSRLPSPWIRRTLAAVLLAASIKMIVL